MSDFPSSTGSVIPEAVSPAGLRLRAEIMRGYMDESCARHLELAADKIDELENRYQSLCGDAADALCRGVAQAQPQRGNLPMPVKHYTGMPGATINGETIYDWLMDDGTIEAMTPSDVARRRAQGAGDRDALIEECVKVAVQAIGYQNESSLANFVANAIRALKSSALPSTNSK